MEKTVSLLLHYLEENGGPLEKYSIAVGYGYDYKEAETYRDMVEAALAEKYGSSSLPIYQIGATIGVHTGPHPLGLGILERA